MTLLLMWSGRCAQRQIFRDQRLNQVEQLSDHLLSGWVSDGIQVDVGDKS